VSLRAAAFIAAAGVVLVAAFGMLALGPDRERLAYTHRLDRKAPHALLVRGGVELPRGGPPPETREPGWPVANRDYANSRATTDSSIRAANVARLGLAWSMRLRGASKWGSAASGPLIVGSTVYFQDLVSNVYAIELDKGRVRWEHHFEQKAFGPNGPAVGWGRVYAQDGDQSLAALDAASGRLLWRSPLGGPTGQQQPIAFGGSVLTGIAAGRLQPGADVVHTALLDGGASGFAYGVRARDGKLGWQLQTVEKGFWGNPALNSGGGIWFPPALDTVSGTSYWATGNPAPAPGTVDYPNASSRPGPNLYTNSLIAVDSRTGRMEWYSQVLPHDIFHHDLQNAPILVRAGGRDLVVATGKMGVVYALDRDGGALVWKLPVGRHENDALKTLPPGKVVKVFPGFWGGIEVPGATADGVLYFQVEDLPTPYTATAWGAHNGQQTVENHEGRTIYAQGTSRIVAIDAATGKVRWQAHFPTPGFGGVTVVNDLLFTATYDGRIRALRRSDGKQVWGWQAPGGINAWPAVSRDTIVWPVGLGRRPVLIALRLGARGQAPIKRARPERKP
jgi:outer membrane protein assembly factor BamB